MGKFHRLIACAILSFLAPGCARSSGGEEASVPETGELTLTSIQPGDGAINVPLLPTIAVFFSREIDPSSVNEGSFFIMWGDIQLPGSISFDAAQNAAFLNLSDPLDSTTLYSANLEGIRAADGGPLEDFRWEFTTLDGVKPEVLNTFPSDQGFEIDLEAEVVVKFSEPIDSSTLADNFFLEGPGGQIPATVVFRAEGLEAVLTPVDPLNVFTLYRATLNADIQDLAGNGLDEGLVWEFVTIYPVTGEQREIESASGFARNGLVELAPDGNGVAVWLQEFPQGEGTVERVMGSVYDVAFTEWSEPELLSFGNDRTSESLQLTQDDAGNFMVAWIQRLESPLGDNNLSLYSRIFDGGTKTWEEALAVEDKFQDVSEGLISGADDRFFFAVWRRVVGNHWTLEGARFNGTEWSGSSRIDGLSTGDVANASLAAARPTDAIVVYTQDKGDGLESFYIAEYNGSWRPPLLFEDFDDGNALQTSIASDAEGNYVTAWIHENDLAGDGNLTTHVYAATHAIVVGWDFNWSRVDEEDLSSAANVTVAGDPNGIFHAAWDQTQDLNADGQSESSIYTRRFNGSLWDPSAVLLETDNSANAVAPRISCGSFGECVAVWRQRILPGNIGGVGSISLYGSWFNPFTEEWQVGAPVLLEGEPANLSESSLGLGHAARGVALFGTADGQIRATSFLIPFP